MALPILDGNQTATTLSTVLTSGEHIPAHTVVSLGTTAIANIASAVSGVNIGGTVTANINGTPSVTIPQLNRVIQSVATDGVADTTLNFVKIGGHQSGSNQTAHIVHVSAGGAMSVDATDSVVSISNFPSTQTIAGTVTVGNSTTASAVAVRLIAEDTNPGGAGAGVNVNLYSNDNALLVDALKNGNSVLGYDGLSSYVQVKQALGSSVTISSLPAISGTVTANGGDGTFLVGGLRSGSKTALSLDVGTGYLQTKVESLPSISGTVTIGVVSQGAFGATINGYTTDTGGQLFQNCVPVKLFHGSDARLGTVTIGNSVTIGSLPAISGTVTATIRNGEDAILNDAPSGYTVIRALSHWSDNVDNEIKNTSQSNPLPISGTVTAAAPNGSLTTRFGTPTTANTAFATSAVTNANRKYLLIQNVTTGSNVITVGIGFTPTTTQGIQLTAGAGITFESSYIPTGAVYVLSSVTASNFTILEA